MSEQFESASAEETFAIGERLGATLGPGAIVLLYGGLGAGKTIFVKGALSALGYDPREVTSPSFALVNLYRAGGRDVYHIDLWRLHEGSDAAIAVGLDEILENEDAIVLIEWADRLSGYAFGSPPIKVKIEGGGDEPRHVTVESG